MPASRTVGTSHGAQSYLRRAADDMAGSSRRVILTSTAFAAIVGLLTSCAWSTLAQTARPARRSVHPIGVLFHVGKTSHGCTGSVVHSPGHNLVLTAAHCVGGDGTDIRFAPAYHDGASPYGRWRVTHAYFDATWISRHDWRHDYAILTVASRRWHGELRNIEDVVGANSLGTAPVAGQRVTVTGYVAGSDDKPVTCDARVYYTRGYPSFDCDGYRAGTSGSPWVASGRIYGVIGGLHHGGCFADTSYSSPFSADTLRLWRRARAGVPGDLAPEPESSDC
jgi:V8-like Glu-specific endopeptidase